MARDELSWNNVSANANAGSGAFISGSRMLAGALENLRAPLDRANKINQQNAQAEAAGNTGALISAIRRGEKPELTGAYDSKAIADAQYQYLKDERVNARANAAASRAASAFATSQQNAKDFNAQKAALLSSIGSDGQQVPQDAPNTPVSPLDTPIIPSIAPDVQENIPLTPSQEFNAQYAQNNVTPEQLNGPVPSESAFTDGLSNLDDFSSSLPDINMGEEDNLIKFLNKSKSQNKNSYALGIGSAKTTRQLASSQNKYVREMQRIDMEILKAKTSKDRKKAEAKKQALELEQTELVGDFIDSNENVEPIIKSGYNPNSDENKQYSSAIEILKKERNAIPTVSSVIKDNKNYFKDLAQKAKENSQEYNKKKGYGDRIVDSVIGLLPNDIGSGDSPKLRDMYVELNNLKSKGEYVTEELSGEITPKEADKIRTKRKTRIKDIEKEMKFLNKKINIERSGKTKTAQEFAREFRDEQSKKKKEKTDQISILNKQIAKRKKEQGPTIYENSIKIFKDRIAKSGLTKRNQIIATKNFRDKQIAKFEAEKRAIDKMNAGIAKENRKRKYNAKVKANDFANSITKKLIAKDISDGNYVPGKYKYKN